MERLKFYCAVLFLIMTFGWSHAQEKSYPHLQIFLVSSEAGGNTPFIAFWDGDHQLAAGPFPIRLLELNGLQVSIDLSYSEPRQEVMSNARLRVKKLTASATQDRKGPRVLDEAADWIARRGVSRIFPEAPFVVIGRKKPSEGVLWVGNVMREIQDKILACDQKYRKALKATLHSMKGTASYDHALRVVESAFPSCP